MRGADWPTGCGIRAHRASTDRRRNGAWRRFPARRWTGCARRCSGPRTSASTTRARSACWKPRAACRPSWSTGVVNYGIHVLPSAMGRAILAWSPEVEREAILDDLRKSDEPHDRLAAPSRQGGPADRGDPRPRLCHAPPGLFRQRPAGGAGVRHRRAGAVAGAGDRGGEPVLGPQCPVRSRVRRRPSGGPCGMWRKRSPRPGKMGRGRLPAERRRR